MSMTVGDPKFNEAVAAAGAADSLSYIPPGSTTTGPTSPIVSEEPARAVLCSSVLLKWPNRSDAFLFYFIIVLPSVPQIIIIMLH